MSNHKVLAVWFLWLLAVVQPGASWPGKQHKQKQRHSTPGQQQEQEPLNAFLGVLAAQTAPAVSAYQSVQAYSHSLSLPLRANGQVYRGSSARLRKVLSKLTRGEPVYVAAVGSAITYGRGVKRGTSDWFTLFSSWLQAAFPAAKVTVKNHALPAARSEYLSACLDQHIDPLADLVFVELTAADGYLDTSINNELVHAFERLVRKLLKLPNKPAVVVLNALQASRSSAHSSLTLQQQLQQQLEKQPTKQQHTQKQKQQAKPGTGLQQQQQQPFYHTIEDHFGVVAQFYELQWLSVRNAAWQGLAHGWEGFKPQELFTEVKHPGHPHHPQQQQQQQQQQQPHAASSTKPAPSAQHQQQQQQQQGASPVTSRHLQQQASLLPSILGHKYMADLAVHLLQQTFLQQLLRPLGPSDAAAADGELRGPMFPGNWEGHGSGCAAGLDLRAAVRDAHTDWYFVTEGTPTHPRWGFVSHTPNASLVLRLDTRSKGADRAVPQLTTLQKVQLLQRHGMFREATKLLTAEGAVPMPRPIQIPQVAPKGGADQAAAAAGLRIWQGNGLEAAMAEAERQAAEAAIQLRLGQVKPYVNSERIVGANPYSALQLPAEARMEVGKTQTGTGVEVILPSKVGHRRRLQQQQQQYELTANDLPSSSSSSSSSGKRVLHAAANPLLVPPPYDAVYLKPGAAGGGGAGASKPSNSSGGAAAAPGTVGASIFSEYSLRPQPNMIVMIGYLKGPRMMGRARISCISGCSCSPLTVDGWHAHPHIRLATAKLHVTQSPECLVEVKVLPQSSSGHHKFKVTGVLVSQSAHYTSPDSEWAHQYFLHPDLLPVTTE